MSADQAASTASQAAPSPSSSSSNRVLPTLSGLPLELKAKIVEQVQLASLEVNKQWYSLCAAGIWKDITIWDHHARSLAFLSRTFLPRHARHVRTFRWLSEEDDELPTTSRTLAGLIESLPHLDTLSLSFSCGDPVPRLRKAVPVKHLRLYVRDGWRVDPAFFAPFSSTLESLVLDRYDTLHTSSYSFPKLTHLAVNNQPGGDRYNHGAKADLEPFRKSPVEYLYIHDATSRYLVDLYAELKYHTDTLKVLRIGNSRAIYSDYGDEDSPGTRNAIEALCKKHGIDATLPRLVTADDALRQSDREEEAMMSGIMDDLPQDDPYFWQ